MSSSYFDAQPAKTQPPTALLDVPKGSDMANASLLSPQLSRILDDLPLEDKSSSDEDSEPDIDTTTSSHRKPRRGSADKNDSIAQIQPAVSSLPHSGKRVQKPQPLPYKPARFHSLRSMLFQSHIEDNIQKRNETKMQEQPEARWKAEYDLRKGLNRPKTPESHSPPMQEIAEEDNASTASDDEDMDHSDIEDLIRWVSRRDPPSDGEARKKQVGTTSNVAKEDSGHESLGNSDVDDLIQWVSRREQSRPENEAVNDAGYSDASTESDSDGEPRHNRKDPISHDDVDDLVRWISHKDGPNAGPVREKQTSSASSATLSRAGSETPESHTDELARWVTRKDESSGESTNASRESLKVMGDYVQQQSKTGAAPVTGSRLKREVSHTAPAPAQTKTKPALTDDDVDELVHWVSRKQSNVPVEQEGTKKDVIPQ